MICVGPLGLQTLSSLIRKVLFEINGLYFLLITACVESVFSAFFRKGQVLETFRGNGVYQESVDTAIKKLNEGLWVRLLFYFMEPRSSLLALILLLGAPLWRRES